MRGCQRSFVTPNMRFKANHNRLSQSKLKLSRRLQLTATVQSVFHYARSRCGDETMADTGGAPSGASGGSSSAPASAVPSDGAGAGADAGAQTATHGTPPTFAHGAGVGAGGATAVSSDGKTEEELRAKVTAASAEAAAKKRAEMQPYLDIMNRRREAPCMGGDVLAADGHSHGSARAHGHGDAGTGGEGHVGAGAGAGSGSGSGGGPKAGVRYVVYEDEAEMDAFLAARKALMERGGSTASAGGSGSGGGDSASAGASPQPTAASAPAAAAAVEDEPAPLPYDPAELVRLLRAFRGLQEQRVVVYREFEMYVSCGTRRVKWIEVLRVWRRAERGASRGCSHVAALTLYSLMLCVVVAVGLQACSRTATSRRLGRSPRA